jgi:hypothetical protein
MRLHHERTYPQPAEPLDFPDRRPKPEITITVHCRVNGFDTELCFSGQVEQLDAITRRLASLGAEPVGRAAPPATEKKPRAERVEPIYNGDGDACCPKHKKPLKDGKWGLYCPAKDDSTERGYCALKFIDA